MLKLLSQQNWTRTYYCEVYSNYSEVYSNTVETREISRNLLFAKRFRKHYIFSESINVITANSTWMIGKFLVANLLFEYR